MIICIDSGNSRIKWGVRDADRWLAQGALAHAELAGLGALLDEWQPGSVWLSNVAGPHVLAAILQTLRPWQALIREVKSGQSGQGVRNGYENPGQLGVDRWSALIGARGITRAACLVVMAGTATTIDTMDASGQFLGGLILPGLDLMRHALARGAADLPLACGKHEIYPRNTDDAIVSGCLDAQLGAIERAFARISAVPDAVCLLSGGAAPRLAAQLSMPHLLIDNLVLEGLARQGLMQGS